MESDVGTALPQPMTRFDAFEFSFSSHISKALRSLGPEAFKQHFQNLPADKHFALFDLYRQMLHQMHTYTKADFQEFSTDIHLREKLSALEQLEEESAQRLLRGAASQPAVLARSCRVQQKESEAGFLEELLKQEEEKQTAAEAELKEQQTRLENVLASYHKVPETLSQVQNVCQGWIQTQS